LLRNKLKVVFINLVILGVLLTVIELIFGGWLAKSNNLNHLLVQKNESIEIDISKLYSNDKDIIKVSWDKFGFRGGPEVFNHPENIDILCIGGSTTMQLYVEDGKTWPDVLEKELLANDLDLHLANAGINGQSTFGHIRDFELWFPQVPNLHPKYILFYIGINDFHIQKGKAGSDEIGTKGFSSLKENIRDNSALYSLYRVINGAWLAHQYESDHSKVEFNTHEYGTHGLIDTLEFHSFFQNRLVTYQQRLERLVSLSAEMGAIPVFITQPSRRFKFNENGQVIGIQKAFKQDFSGYQLNGTDYYNILVEMNKVVMQVAKENGLTVIDQTHENIWSDEDFYDFSHTTPKGSEKIAQHIASHLLPLLNGQ
jgi:lysophospholipase L1-like esterase